MNAYELRTACRALAEELRTERTMEAASKANMLERLAGDADLLLRLIEHAPLRKVPS